MSTAAASPVAEQTYHLFMSSPGVMPHKKSQRRICRSGYWIRLCLFVIMDISYKGCRIADMDHDAGGGNGGVEGGGGVLEVSIA